MGYFYSDEELAHHGILGQKWGVRRFENKDGTLTPAGRSRYDTDSNGNYKKANKKGLTDGQKKVLKTSAAIAGTILVAYGGYKLATSPKARGIANNVLQGNKTKRLTDIDKEIASMGPEIVKKKATEVTKKAVNTVKPNLADKKQADIAKKAVKSMSEGLKSSSPANFEFEKFMPETFDFDKFEYESNELVDGLLKKNARMLGL